MEYSGSETRQTDRTASTNGQRMHILPERSQRAGSSTVPGLEAKVLYWPSASRFAGRPTRPPELPARPPQRDPLAAGKDGLAITYEGECQVRRPKGAGDGADHATN